MYLGPIVKDDGSRTEIIQEPLKQRHHWHPALEMNLKTLSTILKMYIGRYFIHEKCMLADISYMKNEKKSDY